MIEKEWAFFSRKPAVYLAGYSINALLAIEMAYQLEKRGIYPKGLFLLDLTNSKRAQFLKRKKFSKNIWLASENWHKSLKIDFFDHLELVNTTAGIDSWLSMMVKEIHHRFNTDAVMRETAVIRC
jgi:thioesterase domain-containing protein